MASVTQCDRCKKTCKHEESMFIRINTCTCTDDLGRLVTKMDLCPDCYKEVKEVLEHVK